MTGDGIAIAIKHGVELKDITYVQIHPTTFYTKEKEQRSFLISESVRGEGAKLYDKHGKRFVNELLPRDLLTAEIHKQMEKMAQIMYGKICGKFLRKSWILISKHY